MEELRILLLEDDRAGAPLVRELLAEAPGAALHVSSAGSLSEAGQLLTEGYFDAIVLDLGLSAGERQEVIETVKALAGRAPIVVVGDIDDSSVATRMLWWGVHDYLVKAKIDADTLIRSLHYARERKKILDRSEAYTDYLSGAVKEQTLELESVDQLLAQQIGRRVHMQRLNELTARLLKKFIERHDAEAYLQDAVTTIRDWSGCGCAALRIYDTRGSLRHEHRSGSGGKLPADRDLVRAAADDAFRRELGLASLPPTEAPLVTARGSFHAGDTAAVAALLPGTRRRRFEELVSAHSFASLAVVEIRRNSEGVGTVVVADGQAGRVDAATVESLEAVVPLIAQAMDRFDMDAELRLQHERIIHANEVLERIFADTNMHIVVLDKDLHFVKVNQAYAQANGGEPESYVGKGYFDLSGHGKNEKIFRAVLAGGKPHTAVEEPYPFSGRPEQGLSYWDWTLQPLKDEDGRTAGLLLILHDVTARKLAQEQAIRQGQLACLGELAAGVAHEVNNPITGMINYAQIILDENGRDSRAGDLSKRIIKEGERIAAIVRNLLAFAREERRDRRAVGVSSLLAETFGLAARHLERDGIRVDIYIPKEIPPVLVNNREIGQVFLNILSNARHALNQKYPSAHPDKILEIQAKADSSQGPKGVTVSFRDHGTGIPARILSAVTQAFFTTKTRQHGTGLGLSISQRILDEHGGSLTVSSVEGESTTVEVLLPTAEGKRE